jgi:hypothetical protein
LECLTGVDLELPPIIGMAITGMAIIARAPRHPAVKPLRLAIVPNGIVAQAESGTPFPRWRVQPVSEHAEGAASGSGRLFLNAAIA